MATTPVTINLDTDKVTAEVRAYIDKKLREVERLHELRDAAISWRESYGNTSPAHAAACDALVTAVDEMGEVAW